MRAPGTPSFLRKWAPLLIVLAVLMHATVGVGIHAFLTVRFPNLPGEPAGVYARDYGIGPPVQVEEIHCPHSDRFVLTVNRGVGATCP